VKIEAKHCFIFSISSRFPFTFMNESCWPAKDAPAWSSAVADDLTETKIGSRADFRIASAPGEPSIPARSTLKWSYASRISFSKISGIFALIISSRISFVLSVSFSVLSTSIVCMMSFICCSSFVSLRNK